MPSPSLPWSPSPSPSSVVEQVAPARRAVVADGVVPAPQREVDLEDRLEGPPVGVVLHQRGRQGVLERLAVLERDVLDRLHGVEVLGEADRQARLAQLGDEPGEQLEHRLPPGLLGPRPVVGHARYFGPGAKTLAAVLVAR